MNLINAKYGSEPGLKAVARQPPCPVPTTTLAGFEAAGVGVFFGFLG
jgi:hypothetical protein